VENLILESEKVLAIIDGHPDVTEFTLIDSEFYGEWRWGTSYQIVIKDNTTQQLWATVYNQQVGDNYYNSLEDGDTVHFYPVEEYNIVATHYRRVE